ncbi:hypothetical protein F7D09_0888 [Bifidobacterium leontopitheci]|uniref:Uncharacterized protein n=1 Tax=Bifidobacterium leontopitheci TaxID=2650774 RepID=A0A6I1GGD2_9BIFI|nr:hypothetical protein F7D09_0888 [Bifidobacterium leontopitheci]
MWVFWFGVFRGSCWSYIAKRLENGRNGIPVLPTERKRNTHISQKARLRAVCGSHSVILPFLPFLPFFRHSVYLPAVISSAGQEPTSSGCSGSRPGRGYRRRRKDLRKEAPSPLFLAPLLAQRKDLRKSTLSAVNPCTGAVPAQGFTAEACDIRNSSRCRCGRVTSCVPSCAPKRVVPEILSTVLIATGTGEDQSAQDTGLYSKTCGWRVSRARVPMGFADPRHRSLGLACLARGPRCAFALVPACRAMGFRTCTVCGCA